MKKTLQRLLLLTTTLLLASCFGPKTPQEVTAAFWEAVIEGDANAVVEYSTLTAAKNYDGFSKEWDGFQPSWGKIEIDGNKASIVSKFTRQSESGKEMREFITHLVKRNDIWLVHYKRTAEEVQGGVLGNLLGQISQLGDDLSKQFQSSAEDFRAEMDRMGKELEEKSEALGKEASENLERYAEELRKSIKALEESINRALEDKNNELSDRDRSRLKEVAADLEQDNERLSEPTLESIAEGSKGIGRAQYELDSIDNDSVAEYKRQWQELAQRFEQNMQQMLNELSASQEQSH